MLLFVALKEGIMKRLLGLFMVILAMSFAVPQDTNAQAVVDKDGVFWLSLGGDYVASSSAMTVITPSGNLLRKIVWYISPCNPYVPKKGVAKIELYGPGHADLKVLVFPDGKVVGIFHENGSGNITPNTGKD